MELFGNIAVITGAASGIGYISARALYQAGAFVYVTDSDEHGGREAIEELRKYGNCLQRLSFVKMDVTDARSIAEAAGEILEECSRVDILVNTVGWQRETIRADKTSAQTGARAARRDTGPAQVTQAFLPSMMNEHKGKIINVTCDLQNREGAHEATPSRPNRCAIAHTRELVDETTRHGINVNCICIGCRDRSFHDPREKPPWSRLASTSPADDGQTGGIGEVTLLFAGDASNGMTGQTLRLNCR